MIFFFIAYNSFFTVHSSTKQNLRHPIDFFS